MDLIEAHNTLDILAIRKLEAWAKEKPMRSFSIYYSLFGRGEWAVNISNVRVSQAGLSGESIHKIVDSLFSDSVLQEMMKY